MIIMEEIPSPVERPHMNTVMVYRLDQETKTKIPLGVLVDRRKSDRGDNVIGMLRLARREFAESERESSCIFISYEESG